MTERDLQEKLAAGLIRGYREAGKAPGKGSGPKKGAGAGKGSKSAGRGDKIKGWIGLNLWHWCRAKGVELATEHPFHPERKWRFDWCVPSLKVAIEYNGIISAKSRHTTVTGYTGDMEKINAAQQMGWRVLQYTPLNHKNLPNDLNKLI